jgi:hypothetical protein
MRTRGSENNSNNKNFNSVPPSSPVKSAFLFGERGEDCLISPEPLKRGHDNIPPPVKLKTASMSRLSEILADPYSSEELKHHAQSEIESREHAQSEIESREISYLFSTEDSNPSSLPAEPIPRAFRSLGFGK